ncbi:extracellular solute-binding protein [Nocardioides bruguierae]|uniref:Extracellular solute-binding protein n=1 Tax=Nocardioides bruguierae TaxID=2945102 RepID=A0A9X2IGX7_9ACTN|nr:extracellular solute-binding protein [Nocardioides bruguierae]MCM0622029.1 extracellular solute-binding protein [Nocardioides bruguierae]
MGRTTRTSSTRWRLGRWRTGVAALALATAGGLLAGCSSDGKPTLTWYLNPDGQDTLNAIAQRCSTDDYDIQTRLLPTSATDQRVQLARRLAAEDDTTDLMNLDVAFVSEFANAGWLLQLPDDTISDDTLSGIASTVQWDDGVYAAPLWANTQVLWYRKSLAEQAGLDMSQPVTWKQVIDAADSVDGATVGVQGNKYEAYVVWINALIEGAGGQILSDPEAGKDAEVDLDTEAGKDAAAVIAQLAGSSAAQSDLSVSNEGTALAAMYGGPGEFMVNWTFVYKNYEPSDANDYSKDQFDDLGWARYPQTVAGEASKPPVGGIDVGVGAYTQYPEYAQEAAACITSVENQVQLAVDAGLMPATSSGYDAQELTDAYPADLLDLYRRSIEDAGPRPQSPFWATVSSAIQATWHSPADVDPDTTPEKSQDYVTQVLEGKALL